MCVCNAHVYLYDSQFMHHNCSMVNIKKSFKFINKVYKFFRELQSQTQSWHMSRLPRVFL